MVIGLGTTYGRIRRTHDRADLDEIRTKQDWSHEAGVRLRNGVKSTFYLI